MRQTAAQNKADAGEIIRLSRLVDKMALSMKQRLFEKTKCGFVGWDNQTGDADYDLTIERMKKAFHEEEWIDVANFATFLWYEDWKRHLGRDFLNVGNEPEHFGVFGA